MELNMLEAKNDYPANTAMKCILSLTDALLQVHDTDGIFGLLSILQKRSTGLHDRLEFKCLSKYISIAKDVTLGRLEYSVDQLKDLLVYSEDILLQKSVEKLLLMCYEDLSDWKSIQEMLESDLRVGDSISKNLKALSVWSTSSKEEVYEAKIDNSKMLNFSIGAPRLIELVSLNLVVNENSLREKEMDLTRIYDIFSFANETKYSSIVDYFVWVQSSMAQTSLETKKESSIIRLGKVKPSEKVVSIALHGENLSKWLRVYNIARVSENLGMSRKYRDPDLDEIGGILADEASASQNLKLAKRLLDSTKNSLTISASLRNSFKIATLLQLENQNLKASQLLLEILEMPFVSGDQYDLEVRAKSCFLFAESFSLNLEDLNVINTLERVLTGSLEYDSFQSKKDCVRHKVLEKATQIAPSFSQTWFRYANYCYRQARKVLEDLNEDHKMFQTEILQVSKLLKSVIPNDFETCLRLLFEEIKDNETNEDWRNYLESGDIQTLEIFITRVKKAIFEQFETAAYSYFKYLKVIGDGNSSLSDRKVEADTITATLRLIRIFAKYGVALSTVFVNGFRDTQLLPWKQVIPQLFSRLYHPEHVVRAEITNLLCRIGSSSPELVIYSTILGVSDKDEAEEQTMASYQQLLNTLMNENPILVIETRKWIDELQRIAVLWEETWQLGLERLMVEMQTRRAKLDRDLFRIRSNTSLSTEEKKLIERNNIVNVLKPIIYSIEQMCDKTIRKTPVTPHELTFFGRFADKIDQNIKALENIVSLEAIDDIWKEFKGVLLELQKDLHTKGSHTLSLQTISPYLSNLKNYSIRIPGFEDVENMNVASIVDEVRVLPSKTKPKKLKLVSVNGKEYSFLLKGHEDLHLDERIQQFITIANTLLSSDAESYLRKLNARSYSVIPFGNSFGMIQWVDNASGLFSLYRKHKLWESAIKHAHNKDKKPTILRPQEIFQSKISIAHRNGKLDIKTRQNWPSSVLRDIFIEMQNETPDFLIENEMLCSSASADDWWYKTKRFSRSVAVMSIIGYILGLGDRHLDNILLDVKDGSLVHIDFNVCFEKGKRLRIPETVPFRLTQNLVKAFGPTGVEGNYRSACEHTLRVLRSHREILLTLLEAFIYDPVVDWTKRNDSGKQIFNLNISIGSLRSRINELKSSLNDGSIQIAAQSSTLAVELKLTKNCLEKQKILMLHKDMIPNQMELDYEIELQNSIGILKTIFSKSIQRYKELYFRNKTFIESFDVIFGELTLVLKNLVKVDSTESMIFIDLYRETLISIEWFKNILSDNKKLFISMDYYGILYLALSPVLEKNNLSSWESGLSQLSKLQYFRKSKYLEHLGLLHSSIERATARVFNLEILFETLSKKAIIKQNTFKVTPSVAHSVTLYILSQTCMLIQREREESMVDEFVGDDYCFMKESLLLILNGSDFVLSLELESVFFIISMCVRSLKHLNGNIWLIIDVQNQMFVGAQLLEQFKHKEDTLHLLLKVIRKLTDALFGQIVYSLVRGLYASRIVLNKIIELGKKSKKLLEVNLTQECLKVRKEFDSIGRSIDIEDVEANELLNTIHLIVQYLNDMFYSQTTPEKKKQSITLFLKCISMVGSLIENSVTFVETNHLQKLDPSAELANTLDFSELFKKSEFEQSKNEIIEFIRYIRDEIMIKSFLNLCEQTTHKYRQEQASLVVKGWGERPFQENSGNIIIDEMENYLNLICSSSGGDAIGKIRKIAGEIKSLTAISLIKTLCGETEKYLEMNKVFKVQCGVRCERYEIIHAAQLFDSHKQIQNLSSRVSVF
jgi:hypothetical protein